MFGQEEILLVLKTTYMYIAFFQVPFLIHQENMCCEGETLDALCHNISEKWYDGMCTLINLKKKPR